MGIKPIETEYKGYRFRSRLEARWAVFFDNCGFKWEYEPQGYDIDGVRYLPDFRLYEAKYPYHEYDNPEKPFFVEVKGEMDEASRQKVRKLSEHYPLYVVGDIPYADDPYDYEYLVACAYSDDIDFFTWSFMQGGGGYTAIFADKDGKPYFPWNHEIKDMDIEKTMSALRAARAARFEYGERGV